MTVTHSRSTVAPMLSDQESGALADHINAKWADTRCLICGERSWTFQGVLQLELHSTGGWGLIPGKGLALPTAAVICDNCGNTVLVNLVIAGIVAGR